VTRREMAAECERVKTATAGTSDKYVAMVYVLATVLAALVREESR
jgi:hypothetical protein